MGDGLGSFDAQAIYDEVARDYEVASRQFWQQLSTRTVGGLGLFPGQRVLDVPCGTGPSLLAAAERVGQSGYVVGIDYSDQMVAIAREKTKAAGLGNVEFRIGDMTTLQPGAVPFDAVVCCLGLFFAPDMPDLIRTLIRLVRPDTGRLAVTVFGQQLFDPVRAAFVDIVSAVAPEVDLIEPWRRTEDLSVFRSVFRDAGVDDVAITTVEDRLPLPSPDDWWSIVMGSGFRHTVTALGEDRAATVRDRCTTHIRDHGIDEIVTNAYYAIARPSGPAA